MADAGFTVAMRAAEGADAENGPRPVYLEPTPADEVWSAIMAAVRDANRTIQYADLGGMRFHTGPEGVPCEACERGECLGANPLDVLAETLERGLAEVKRQREHQHVWDSDHRCDVCGADGLA